MTTKLPAGAKERELDSQHNIPRDETQHFPQTSAFRTVGLGRDKEATHQYINHMPRRGKTREEGAINP
jgi:hypothetical protein